MAHNGAQWRTQNNGVAQSTPARCIRRSGPGWTAPDTTGPERMSRAKARATLNMTRAARGEPVEPPTPCHSTRPLHTLAPS